MHKDKDKLHKLFQRYLRNELSETEIKEFHSLFHEHEDLEQFNELLLETWNNEKETEQLQTKEADYPIPKINTWHKTKTLRRVLAIAGCLLVGFIGITLVKQNFEFSDSIKESTQIIVSTKEGQRKKIMLPDSSVVELNSNSTLSYQQSFNKETRELLFTGEAFFDIKKNPKKPFIIRHEKMYIKVLGTSFNVRSYDDENEFEVYVKTGLVEIGENKASSKNQHIFGQFKPQDLFLYKHDTELAAIKHQVEENNFTGWRDQILIFENQKFTDVAEKLERWYGLNITIEDEALRAQQFTGEFKHLSIRQVLDLLQMSTPFEYQINGKEISINSKE